MGEKKSTAELDKILGKLNPDNIRNFFEENVSSLFIGKNEFSRYMRKRFKEKGYTQQQIFLRADIPERYGYKLISGQKHTNKRDVIIKLCVAGRFSLTETNRALKLYGMNELYSRIPRDALIMNMILSQSFSIDALNYQLHHNGFDELSSFSIE